MFLFVLLLSSSHLATDAPPSPESPSLGRYASKMLILPCSTELDPTFAVHTRSSACSPRTTRQVVCSLQKKTQDFKILVFVFCNIVVYRPKLSSARSAEEIIYYCVKISFFLINMAAGSEDVFHLLLMFHCISMYTGAQNLSWRSKISPEPSHLRGP